MTDKLPLNKWQKIRQVQKFEDGKYVYKVFVNNERIYKVINKKPQEFNNVKVYVGDEWYKPQPGYIRNLKIPGM